MSKSRQTPTAGQPVTPDTRSKVPSCGIDDQFSRKLATLIRASYRIIFIPTAERERAEGEIENVARSMQKAYHVATWDVHQGFNSPGTKKALSEEAAERCKQPVFALDHILTHDVFPPATIVVMRNLDDWFVEPRVRQRLETFAQIGMDMDEIHRTLIIISPKEQIHDKLKPMITVLPLALPDETKLRYIVDNVVGGADQKTGGCPEELRDKLATALLGCNALQAENIMASTVIDHRGQFHDDMTLSVQAEKAVLIKSDGILSFIARHRLPRAQDIGGVSELMRWLERARHAYSPGAAAIKLDNPKGIVLVGPPGTGKSAVAKACGAILDLPVFMFNVAAVFGHLVGESEQRMRTALNQIEAVKGSVVILDEADKALAGAKDSSGDTSGVTRRVFGQFLTWLAEKEDRTFVILTLNRTGGLDPELLRAGRFDNMFYTDLPSVKERREILDIHLRKRGLAPEVLKIPESQWSLLCEDALNEFVGSEIEQTVVNARQIAYADGARSVPTLADLMAGAAEVTPLARRDSDAITSIREFCKKSGGRPVNGAFSVKSSSDRGEPRRGRRPLDVGGSGELS